MLPVNLLQLTDTRGLLSNAVGAVCFVAAYNVSKAFSRAAAHADGQIQNNDAGDDQDDLLYSQLQSTDVYAETLWNLRMSFTREMRDRSQTVSTPPLRLLAQELQGDMPLYMNAQTRTWTWLEPFKLEPEMQALLQRMAASRATKAPPSRIPWAPPRDTVLWARISGSRIFRRVDDAGTPGSSSSLVQLPLGEYCALPAALPFYGLGPHSAVKTVLTENGWTRGSTASTSGNPSVSNAGVTANSGTQDTAQQESSESLPPFATFLNDSAFPLFPPTDCRSSERRGFFKLTSLSPPPTLPRKRKAAPATADDAGSSKAARTDDAASQPSARSQLSLPPVTPPSTLPRRRSPPGAPRRRRPGPLSPMPTLRSEMRASPFTWSSRSPFVSPSDRAEWSFRP